MSKAFTKDDDGGDGPLLVAPRVPLPSGSPNYVTERGLALLRAELGQELERWAARTPPTSDTERARAGARHAARVAELEARIGCAVLVDSARQRTYRIVGVDEANAASGDVAFVAPLARSLLGKRVGDVELVRTPAGEDELEVLAIEYD
jgi:transcription elongation factor GreB